MSCISFVIKPVVFAFAVTQSQREGEELGRILVNLSLNPSEIWIWFLLVPYSHGVL